MKNVSLKVMHESGLNARPAALFVQTASKFDSRIWLETGGKKVNAKSIMGVMSLGVKQDDNIEVVAQGDDEDQAIKALTTLIDSNFSLIPE